MKPRTLAKIFGVVPLLAAALALPGSAGAQPPRYGYGPYGPQNRPYASPYASGGIIDGYVSAERGPCLVLRDRQNRSYYLQGDTRGLRPGDQVRLRERMVSRSSCGNDGPTLEVLEIRTIWTNGSRRSAYFDSRRDGSFDRFVLRNRDRGGWYADRYSYMRRGGDRYAPNGPYDRGGRPYDQPQYDRQPYDRQDRGQYAPEPPDQSQPPYEPNGQYDDQGDDQNGPPYDDQSSGDQPVSVDGTLDFSHACPQIRAGNVTYDLAGNLGNYHDGDRVHVDGVLAGSSSCGGSALEVRQIRRR